MNCFCPFFLLMALFFFWYFPKENPKPPFIPIPSPSCVEMITESPCEMVAPDPGGREQKPQPHTSGSQENGLALGTRPSSESASPSGQSTISNRRRGPDGVPEGLDVSPLCSETHFESDLCVHNYSIQLSSGMLEKSAQAYSTLQVPAVPDKGTVRKMAWSMVE